MISRVKYIDLSPGIPPSKKYDLVELKYDGHYTIAMVKDGTCTFVSRTGKLVNTIFISHSVPNIILIGELMRGTLWAQSDRLLGKFIIFDIFESGKLLERRKNLEHLLALGIFPSHFYLTDQHPASDWKMLWEKYKDFEGLVFKKSDGLYGEPHARMKREVTVDYVCMGMNPGKGRNKGVTGSIQGGVIQEGIPVHVCDVSGLTDWHRKELWDNQDNYIGRNFEAKGKALFPSGALRHPIFVKWRDDIF
jgi:ATP-dependent DNA ligase